MTTSQKIARIIEQRLPLVEKIEIVENNLRYLLASLNQLQNQRNLLISRTDDPQIKGKLENSNFNQFQQQIEAELAGLTKLKTRFARKTINIGVVGRAGQGKSRLLQSLSGLSSAEIPTGDRQHCTGVRSTIYHNPSIDTYAEVSFHSERSFLDEIITPYYEKLNLGLKPITLDEFAENQLPNLPDEFNNNAVMGAMYEHLKRYHDHLDKYRHLLQEISPRRITKDKIREYVAQDTLDGQRIYFNYLAVKEAKIVCKFPNPDASQIALIDMPGLGDTGLGDEKRLIEILGQDIDIVIFVRMPKPLRDFWADVDVKLYDTANSALTDLPLKLWSFMILNHTDNNSPIGDNYVYCQDLANSRQDHHLQVVDCLIANCANSQEANNKILDPILDYLVQNITNLDHQYASACQERLRSLQTFIASELDKVRQILKFSGDDNWFPLFESLFAELWDNLTTGLEELLTELKEESNQQDDNFKEQVDAVIETCKNDPGLPTIEEIEQMRNSKGGYPNAYYQYLNEVRSHLSQHFLVLDESLKKCVEQVKLRVINILIHQGRLGGLTPIKNTNFLQEITNLISDEHSQLKFGFQILADFDLSYRGMIQHRIRQHLNDLTPDETSLQLSNSPSAKEVLACLQSVHAEAVYSCENALETLLAEPNQAAFAIVEEFLDRVLRAKKVKNEWRIFLAEFRSEVWSDEFKQLGEHSRTLKQWQDCLDKVNQANQVNNLQFLN
jgi:hypothetical protein